MNGPMLVSIGLLILASLIVSLGAAGVLVLFLRTKPGPAATSAEVPDEWAQTRAGFQMWPERWLAIKGRKPAAVQAALGLHHARACSWLQGLLGEKPFFIAPPLEGWTVVVGSGLPDPAADVDQCFQLVTGLSRKLGQVQFFSINRPLHYHAWVWAKRGRVVRAYAWAGKTLWNQGSRTPSERQLAVKCFGYIESPDETLLSQRESAEANVDKVPRLAALWGLDPAHLGDRCVNQALGIAGERS